MIGTLKENQTIKLNHEDMTKQTDELERSSIASTGFPRRASKAAATTTGSTSVKGICQTCRIKTHTLFRFPIYSKDVWNGICIRCNPSGVPETIDVSYHQMQRKEVKPEEDNSPAPHFSTASVSHGSATTAKKKDITTESRRSLTTMGNEGTLESGSIMAKAVPKMRVSNSARNLVSESWELVQGDLQSLGMEFFLTIFEKYPQLRGLFSFGDHLKVEDLKNSRMLKAHAKLVMTTVGGAVEGLSDMEALIPVLRKLGRMHTLIGVQPEYYDLIYTILIDLIAKRVGASKWTSETRQAWEVCYFAITSFMKDPTRLVDIEPVEDYGLFNAAVCGYLAVSTPFRLAGFQVGNFEYVFHLLDLVTMGTFLLDWSSGQLQYAIKLKTKGSDSYPFYHQYLFPVKFKLNRMIRSLRLDRWVPWPNLDVVVILSFTLQYNMRYLDRTHPVYLLVGIVRLVCLFRLVHFAKCAELVALKRADMQREQFDQLQLGKLAVMLVYMIHLFGCFYCMVSGLEAKEGGEPAAFAPLMESLLEGGDTLNAYLHASYWAFVNVAGIGNFDSAPESSLELIFTMLVHFVGATFYAIAAGSIFSILENRAASFNQIGEAIQSLTEFMEDCDVPKSSQDKVLSSYLMRNLAGRGSNGREDGPIDRPLVPDSAEDLPSNLHMELTYFSRAKALRTRGIKGASDEFSFFLAENLEDNLTLLPGDYLFQTHDQVTRRVIMVDKGVLEVVVNGRTAKSLYPGDVIGLGWLTSYRNESDQAVHQKASVDWVSAKGIATADIRATTSCRLVMGLSSEMEVGQLRRLYRSDIKHLEEIYEFDN